MTIRQKDNDDFKHFQAFVEHIAPQRYILKQTGEKYPQNVIDCQMSGLTDGIVRSTADVEIKDRMNFKLKYLDTLLLEEDKRNSLMNYSESQHKYYVNYFKGENKLLMIDLNNITEDEWQLYASATTANKCTMTDNIKKIKKQIYLIPKDKFSAFTFNFDRYEDK